MEELKPCPFCGAERTVYARGLDTGVQGILCLGCKVQVRFPIEMKGKETFGENETKWAQAWNRRASDVLRRQQVSGLRRVRE